MRTRTRHNAEELWAKHQRQVYRLAHAWHATTGIELEELISIGRSAFMRAVMLWDPSRSSFNTWLWRTMHQTMLRETTKMRKRGESVDPHDPSIERLASHDNGINSYRIRDWAAGLQGEVGFLIRLVLDAPEEGIDLVWGDGPQRMRRAVRTKLRQKGWSTQHVNRAFRLARIEVSSLM